MKPEKDEAIEIYVHIPFCVKKCAYCDFYSHPADEVRMDAYFHMLTEEISLYPYTGREVSSVFFGGGTPSIVKAERISGLLQKLRQEYRIREDAEITIEMNPGTVTAEKLRIYRNAGINRLSIGLQSASDQMLKRLGRIHTFRDFSDTFRMARAEGFQNISLDLISGLPQETPAAFEESLKKALSFEPEHISVYALIIEENTPFYELYGPSGSERTLLPDEDTERESVYLAERILKSAGYDKYEISNYAKPGFESRHNLGYWTGVPYLGFGAAAASCINGMRFRNASNDDYLSFPYEECEVLSKEDQMSEMMILGLRLVKGVSLSAFRVRFDVDPLEKYGPVIEKYRSLGALALSGDRLSLTSYGMDTANIVMADFM